MIKRYVYETKLDCSCFQATQQIRSNKEHLCMETNGNNLKLAKCDGENKSQKWIWREFYY